MTCAPSFTSFAARGRVPPCESAARTDTPATMKTRRLLPAFFVLSTAPLLANGGGYLQGIKSTGPFRPVNVDSVEMVSEKLDIELKEDAAVVSIIYQLHNPGKAVKVEMGFPCAVAMPLKFENGKPPQPPTSPLPQLESFSLTADGAAVKSELMKDHTKLPGNGPLKEEESAYDGCVITGWQVVKLPFAAGQTRTVSVKYRNPYYRETYSISNNSDISAPSMRYQFSAAALWSGSIKKGEVTVRATGVDPNVVSLSHPKRFQREGRVWKWTFTDFEPTMQDDLEIMAGEHEFIQWREKEEASGAGSYVMRGRSREREELQKSGKWLFIGRQYTATASSSLKPDGRNTYGPENLNDESRDNAWAEGAEGDGIGETLTLTMKQPQKVTRLRIHNGYGKQPLCQLNNRVKKLAVSINGGAPFMAELTDGRVAIGYEGSFWDSRCWVDLPKDAGLVKTVELTIKEVYRGTKFRDTCISAVDVEVPLSKAPPIFPCR